MNSCWTQVGHTQLAALDGHVADVLCVAFRTDGRLLATASADGEVIWPSDSCIILTFAEQVT